VTPNSLKNPSTMAALFRNGSLAKPIMRIVARTAFESGSIAKLKPLSSFPLNAGILGVNTTRSFSIGKQNYALVKSDFQHSGLDFEQKTPSVSVTSVEKNLEFLEKHPEFLEKNPALVRKLKPEVVKRLKPASEQERARASEQERARASEQERARARASILILILILILIFGVVSAQ